MNNLLARILSGIILIALVLFVSVKGGLVLFLSTIILSFFASLELYNALKKLGYRYPLGLQILMGIIFNLSIYQKNYPLALFILSLNIIFALVLTALGKRYKLEDMMAYNLSFLYTNLLFSFFILFTNHYQVILVFLCSWGTDTFAYVFGIVFGKTKLNEILSPNKSVEGAIGGALSCVILVIIYLNYLNKGNLFLWALASFCLSIVSQIGDLSASYIKRKTKIKDFGFIIFGHGGILDRFDSVMFVLPVAYYLFYLLGGLK